MNVQQRTCLVYDPKCLEHIPKEEIESPARVSTIQAALSTLGLKVLPPKRAANKDILRCHTIKYLKTLEQDVHALADSDANDKGYVKLSTGDTNICQASVEVAHWAAGGVLAAIDAVMSNVAKTVFCNIRPPGHHATSDKGMGFCIFNNVAIGARYAQEKYGIKRVCIVDWDVHHGNGTQAIFYEDPSVFYLSTHQKGIYPKTTGFVEETGSKKGMGTTSNHPIEKSVDARQDILKIFKRNLTEKMQEFRPELIIISAGFDARKDDPLGELNLEDEDFAEMTRIVKSIANLYANGRVVSVLEGGYNIQGIASAALAHVKALMEA